MCSLSASPLAAAAGPTAAIAGSVSAAATAICGSSPRKTTRQWNVWATTAATVGPMIPGRTQAVESVANIRGRRSSGNARPIET